ncbi:MAG: hypothetical protein R3D34_12750 [Nitratireductor sp.]|nr:hypothetical protein [Nitratireductor sp.]
MGNYYGLIEVGISFVGIILFGWWQLRSLNRDVKAREERERQVEQQKD